MHILIIPSWYKTPKNPIVGTFFEEQARMLQKRGHQVGILYPDHNIRFLGNSRSHGEKTPKPFDDEGIPTYYCFTESYLPKVGHPTRLDIWFFQIKVYAIFKEYVRLYGLPNVIHAHSVFWGGIAARYISNKTEIPYFLTKHFTGWIINEKRKTLKVYRNNLVKTIAHSKETFIVSSFYQNELRKNYPINFNNVVILPNIVNQLFVENQVIIKHTGKTVISVIGYLNFRKNHLTLFKSIILLLQRGYDAELRVIGDGNMRDILEVFIKENMLEEYIYLLGLKNRNEILKELQESHILVSTSTFETFGVNIIESLAMGRPVVALDSGGPRDIIRDEDGILVKENSPTAIADAIANVIENYDSYDQKEISKRCEERFGEEKIYRQLISEYSKALKSFDHSLKG